MLRSSYSVYLIGLTGAALNNILYDGATQRITGLLDFDWAAVTHPCDEFLFGLWDIGGGIHERVGKIQANVLSGDFSEQPDSLSPEEVRKWETAKTWDVRNLLTLYGVTDEARIHEVLAWTADAKAQAWWQDDIAAGPSYLNYYISLEAEAASIQCYCTPVLHALLQTDEYARAHIRSILPELSDDEVERMTSVRSGRRSGVLSVSRAFRFHAVVDEAALLRRVGSEDVMRRQMEALLDLPEHVEVRVRPLSAGPHRAILSPFSVFTPRVPDLDPVVVVVEASLTESYIESHEEAHRFRDAFTELHDTAFDPERSMALIRSLT